MESPSTRSWLGVGAALTALPAAGGCFATALILAAIVDGGTGAVYEQHRWLGAVVAAGAVCAFAAMMGWATLRHGGVPAPVLLMARALTLRAGDRDACGETVVRRFAVTWRLVRMDAGRAASASAREIGGPEAAARCA